MNILLVGEYSGVHSELAKALRELGHEVVVCSDGDSYKEFERDITISANPVRSRFGAYFNIVKDYIGIRGLLLYRKKRDVLKQLQGFDVVQLINPMALECFGSLANIFLLNNLSKNNKKIFLCALGDDYCWVNACLSNKFKYSAMSRLKLRTTHRYLYSLRYVYGVFFKQLNKLCIDTSEKIIPGLYDYWYAYCDNPKCTGVVPLPISSNKYVHPSKTKYPVKIFHGWQQGKELRKGNDIFSEAVQQLIAELGPELVEYSEVKSVPFSEYQKCFFDADIFLDQCFSYDRGMNALLGMAAGKVVFSGFDSHANKSALTHIGINATPCSVEIFNELKNLILNIETIDSIKQSAYAYAVEIHDSHTVARQYLKIWGES